MTRVVLVSTGGTIASRVDHARGNVRANAGAARTWRQSARFSPGGLTGMKARVLLSVLLGAGFSREVIARHAAQVAG